MVLPKVTLCATMRGLVVRSVIPKAEHEKLGLMTLIKSVTKEVPVALGGPRTSSFKNSDFRGVSIMNILIAILLTTAANAQTPSPVVIHVSVYSLAGEWSGDSGWVVAPSLDGKTQYTILCSSEPTPGQCTRRDLSSNVESDVPFGITVAQGQHGLCHAITSVVTAATKTNPVTLDFEDGKLFGVSPVQ